VQVGDDVTVYIARGGAEIGECRRGDVEQLMREGELLPTDHYWHDGMEDWAALEQFAAPEKKTQPARALQIETTQRIEITQKEAPTGNATGAPAPQAPRSCKALTFPPEARKHLLLAGIIVGGFVFAVLIAVIVIRLGHDPAPVRAAAASAPTPIVDRERDRELRDRAAGQLRTKLEALPQRAEPPLYTFYYDVAVDMRRSGSPRTPWEAIVRGSENTVDPQTEQTTKRTEFMLRVEYRDGQWAFKHYNGRTRNLAKPGESEEEADETTTTPPALVTMLALRVDPVDPRAR
jgi:hypothetical protein